MTSVIYCQQKGSLTLGPAKKRVSPQGGRRMCQQLPISDDDMTDLLPPKKKSTNQVSFSGIGQRVEVRYDKNIWYCT